MNPKLLERGVILTFHKRPGTQEYEAMLRFNTADRGDPSGHTLEVMGWGFGSIIKALGNAVHKATSILQLPGVNLLIPPPFSTAVQLAHHLGSLAAKGELSKLVEDPISGLMVPFFSQIKNPLVRKLAEHMAKVVPAAARAITGDDNAINLLGCVEGDMGDLGDMGRWGGRGWGGGGGRYGHSYGYRRPQYAPPAGWQGRRWGGGPAWGGPWGGPWNGYDDDRPPPQAPPINVNVMAPPMPPAPMPMPAPMPAPMHPAYAPHPVQATVIPGAPAGPVAPHHAHVITTPATRGHYMMGAAPYPGPSFGPDFLPAYDRVYGPQTGTVKIDRWPL